MVAPGIHQITIWRWTFKYNSYHWMTTMSGVVGEASNQRIFRRWRHPQVSAQQSTKRVSWELVPVSTFLCTPLFVWDNQRVANFVRLACVTKRSPSSSTSYLTDWTAIHFDRYPPTSLYPLLMTWLEGALGLPPSPFPLTVVQFSHTTRGQWSGQRSLI